MACAVRRESPGAAAARNRRERIESGCLSLDAIGPAIAEIDELKRWSQPALSTLLMPKHATEKTNCVLHRGVRVFLQSCNAVRSGGCLPRKTIAGDLGAAIGAVIVWVALLRSSTNLVTGEQR